MTARTSEMDVAEYAMMARVEDDHWWYRSLRHLALAALSADGRSTGGGVLDAGCGTGSGLATWSRVRPAVGLDSSREALRHCMVRGLRPLVRGTVEAIPLRSGSFGAAMSLDVLCLEGVDEARALSELFRVVVPGGILILNLPAFEELRGQHDRAVRVRRRYRKEEVTALMRDAGFEVVRAGYWNTMLFPLAWAFRRLRRAAASEPASSDLAPLSVPLNAALVGLLRLEAALFGTRAPFGTSVLVVGRRPGRPF